MLWTWCTDGDWMFWGIYKSFLRQAGTACTTGRFFISHRIWTCSIWLINQPVHFIIPAYWQSVCFGAADEREAATQGRTDQSRREGRSHKGEQCGPGCCVQEQNLWCKRGCVSFHWTLKSRLAFTTYLHQHIAQACDPRCGDVNRVFMFQVYLQAQKKEQDRSQQSLKMLSDEVSQIKEVS